MYAHPFHKYGNKFKHNLPTANPEQEGTDENLKVFGAKAAITPKEVKKKEMHAIAPKTPITLPRHLFIPEGAESIDIRRVLNLPSPTTDQLILRFVAPPGAYTKFISYGVYNDGDDAANYQFKPMVDGNRIFRYHGDPLNNYKIDLGLAPDLSNNSLIPCQLTLEPGQILEFFVTNTSGVDTSMGVRMVGYFDTQSTRVTERFG